VIFLSFIALRSTGRDEATGLAADRADDDDFPVFDEPEYHVPGFTFAVGLTDERRAIHHPPCIFKINLMKPKVPFALIFIPIERSYPREYYIHALVQIA
jgi:hypothetical protein